MSRHPSTGDQWVPNTGRHPDNSVQIHQVTVSYHPLGGGPVRSLPVETFLQEFSIAPPPEQSIPLRMAFFCFDQGPTIYAWTNGHRWNGWGCPLIERSVLERFIQHEDLTGVFALKGDKLHYIEDLEEPEPESPITIEHEGRQYQVYSTANFGLCWNQLYPDEVDPEDGQLVHECLNAISPPGINPTLG